MVPAKSVPPWAQVSAGASRLDGRLTDAEVLAARWARFARAGDVGASESGSPSPLVPR
jgi:hypothetical protein